MPAPLRHDFLVAYTGALDELFLVGAIVCFAGAIAAAVLVRPRDFVGHGPPAAGAAAG